MAAQRPTSSPPPHNPGDKLTRRDFMPRSRLITILACIGLGLFLSLIDTTVVATMLFSIADEFGQFRLSPWVVLSYTLSYVGFAVFISRLADVVGRREVLTTAFAIFLAASTACASSKNIDQLIGFRALQGVGGAGLYAMTMIIYPEICPPSMVPVISALLGIIVAIAGISGPVLGGLLATYANWRWVFWINVPCSVFPAAVLFLVWPKSGRQMLDSLKFTQLDFLGAALVVFGTVLPIFIISQVGIREYAWSSPQTIAVLLFSGLSWIGLVLWQRTISIRPKLGRLAPQFPYRVMKNRVIMCGFLCTTLTGFVMFIAIINIPMRSQIVNSYDAVRSGVLLLPLMGATAVGSAIAGGVSSVKNRTFITLNIASALTLMGSGLLSTLPDSVNPTPKQWGFEVILGFGLGLNLASMTLVVSLNADFRDHAIAQGILAQIRVLGGSIGVSIGFIILNSMVQSTLSGVLTTQQLDDFYRSPAVLRTFGVLDQFYVQQVYIDAFNINMRVCAGVSAVALVASLCTYQEKPPTVKKRLQDLEEAFERRAISSEAGQRS